MASKKRLGMIFCSLSFTRTSSFSMTFSPPSFLISRGIIVTLPLFPCCHSSPLDYRDSSSLQQTTHRCSHTNIHLSWVIFRGRPLSILHGNNLFIGTITIFGFVLILGVFVGIMYLLILSRQNNRSVGSLYSKASDLRVKMLPLCTVCVLGRLHPSSLLTSALIKTTHKHSYPLLQLCR